MASEQHFFTTSDMEATSDEDFERNLLFWVTLSANSAIVRLEFVRGGGEGEMEDRAVIRVLRDKSQSDDSVWPGDEGYMYPPEKGCRLELVRKTPGVVYPGATEFRIYPDDSVPPHGRATFTHEFKWTSDDDMTIGHLVRFLRGSCDQIHWFIDQGIVSGLGSEFLRDDLTLGYEFNDAEGFRRGQRDFIARCFTRLHLLEALSCGTSDAVFSYARVASADRP